MNADTLQLVRSWLTKAEHDMRTARALAAQQPVIGDTCVHHCRQAAEKALKGYLIFHGEQFPKTHDVGLLIELAGEIEPGFMSWHDGAIRLTNSAYFEDPTPDERLEPLDDADTIISQTLRFLPETANPRTN